MPTLIGARIKELREKKNFTQADLAKEFGVSDKSVSFWETKGVKDKKLTQRIADYFGVSLEWLKTGSEAPVMPKVPDTKPKHDHSGLPAMVTVDNAGRDNIILVNTKAQGGYPTLHQDPEFYSELPVMGLPLQRFQNATYRAWEVVGSSMQPGLHPGSIVISQFVENWHSGSIRNGYIHVIVTKETVLIKRLIDRRAKGYFGLMSDNEEFATFNLPVEDVQELWTVSGALVWHFPNSKFEERFKISKLVTDYVDLEERLKKLEKMLKN